MRLLSRKLSLVLGVAALASAPAGAQVTVVDWGTSQDYVTTNTLFNTYTTTGKAFDTTTPFSPASGYTTPSGLSAVFYGGASLSGSTGTGQWNITSGLSVRNNPTTPAFVGSPDALRLYPSWASTTADGQRKYNFVAAFLKTDFLNGANAMNLSVASSGGYSMTYAVGSGYQMTNNRIRFVIRNGSDWYISDALPAQTVGNQVTTISAAFSARSWFTYDPFTSISSTAGTSTPVATFTDVTAVGFWVELSSAVSSNGGTNGGFWVSDFAVTAVPEPAHFAAFASLAILGGVVVRRRRRS